MASNFCGGSKGPSWDDSLWDSVDAWDGYSYEPLVKSDDGYYYIDSAAKLKQLSITTSTNSMEGEKFRLPINLSLQNFEWVPIGSISGGFAGSFDGCGHYIRGVDATNGLFKSLSTYAGSTIKNVTVDMIGEQTISGSAKCLTESCYNVIENCLVRDPYDSAEMISSWGGGGIALLP